MLISRAMPVDVNAERFIPPEKYDVLITDIQESDILQIGLELEHDNLADATEDAAFPVNGTFYGENLRLFVALTVKKKNKLRWVLFLLDTGSPHTFLRTDTYDALGFTTIPRSTQVAINGVDVAVAPSHDHFHNINLLGQNFMKAAQLCLSVNYVTGGVVLSK